LIKVNTRAVARATLRASIEEHAMPRPNRTATAAAAKGLRRTPARPPTPKPAAKRPPQRRAATSAQAAPAAALRWTEVLRDGSHVIIRPIRKQDAALERAFIEGLSPEARRMRFLGQMKTPSEALVRQLTEVDFSRDMAFVALVHRDNQTHEVGVSRYSSSADGKSCECAVAVADAWQNKGLATVLMRHLIDVARARGFRTMVSCDAAENVDMRRLADYLGFARSADPDDVHMVIHRLRL
jgi:GNAT superfamily N-acetyltransferase